MISLTVFVSLLFFYSLITQRLDRTVVTAPIVFTATGMLLFPVLPEILKAGVNAEVLFRLSEIGLVLLLFTDASRTDLNTLRRIGNLPVRLLSIGMLLTIFLGAVAARLVFPHLSILGSRNSGRRARSDRRRPRSDHCEQPARADAHPPSA